MPLNPLTLNVTSGVVGRPFSATVSGQSAGSTLEVGIDGTPGFSTVNGRVMHSGLPYAVNTLVLRETLAGEGVRESRIDILADGVALGASGLPSALAAIGVSPLAQKLRRAAASAIFPDLAPFSAATVTTATGTAYDAALTNVYAQTGGRLLQAVEFTGGYPLPFGTAYRLQVASAGVGNGNLDNDQIGRNAWLGEMSFVVDTATKVQIRMNGANGAFYRVRVDGLYIAFAPQAYAANTDNIVSIDLSALPLGPHRITFELNKGVRVVGVAVAPTASVYRSAPSPDRVIALASGDSYSEGQGSTNSMNAWPKTMGRSLGWADVRQVGLGGTGWQTSGGNGNFNMANQVATWPIINPDLAVGGIMPGVDVLTVGHGYNDADPGSDTTAAPYKALYDAVMLGLQRARAMCPNAWIVVLGPWNGTRGTVTAGSRGANTENCIKAAFTAWADANAAFIPVALATPQSWLTGTGRVGATNGSGNTDAYISADGVHPSDAGHVYLGMRAADGVRRALYA